MVVAESCNGRDNSTKKNHSINPDQCESKLVRINSNRPRTLRIKFGSESPQSGGEKTIKARRITSRVNFKGGYLFSGGKSLNRSLALW